MFKIFVLGGGVSGLTAAYYAKQNPHVEVTLLEQTSRVGGWIRTVKEEGFLFEMGPRSCRASGTGVATLELIKDLGIEREVITAPPEAFRRYLYTQQKLRLLPQSILGLLKQPWFWQFIPALLKEPFVKGGPSTEESVGAFFSRRFSQDFSETFIDPMVSGVFAGDINALSLQSSFPLFSAWEREYGSLIRAMLNQKRQLHDDPFIRKVQEVGLFSFKRGMETLIEALHVQLKDNIILNEEVLDFSPHQNGYKIKTSRTEHYADQVICSLPSKEISKASLAIVNFGFHAHVMNRKGFGYLIPRKENCPVLGAIWDSSAFPQQNSHSEMTRLSFMIGGTHMKNFSQFNEEDFIEMASQGLKTHLGTKTPPDYIRCSILRDAIPQYELGHQMSVSKSAPNLAFIGNHRIGISVNDCISAAKRAVLKNENI